MKRLAILAVAMVSATMFNPASASHGRTYEIKTTKAGFFAMSSLFTERDCDASFVSSPLNGIDSVVIDVGSHQNSTVTLQWTGDSTVAALIGGGMVAEVRSAGCAVLTPAPRGSGIRPGPWSIFLPAGAKWLIITSSWMNNVRLHFV